jgi:hypothetical protein
MSNIKAVEVGMKRSIRAIRVQSINDKTIRKEMPALKV